MSQPSEPHPYPQFFTQLDISPSSSGPSSTSEMLALETVRLLRDLVQAKDRQNELLEEMVNHLVGQQKQRAQELAQWKKLHPLLSKKCRAAAESLSKIQSNLIESLASDVENLDDFGFDSEYMLYEFVDKYGPRLAHFNGVLQVMSQLAAGTESTEGLA